MGLICEKASGRGGGLEAGGYLIASEQNQGTLVLVWSETPVKGALASFHPRAPVPAHKYKTNNGRVELMRQANLGVGKKNYLQGWCQFVKTAKQHDSTLVVRTDLVHVHLHEKSSKVVDVVPGKLTEVGKADGVAVVPKGNDPLAGVKQLPKVAIFCDKVIPMGASTSM